MLPAERNTSELVIARQALEEAQTLQEITPLMDRADILKTMARKAKLSRDAQNDWAEYKLDAERKAGQILQQLDLKPGPKPKPKPIDTEARSSGTDINPATVRTKRPHGKPENTEYEKRRNQIRTKGSVWPLWTCQAYVDRGTNTLVQAAIAKTEDVIAAVTMKLGYGRTTYSGEQFWAVNWSDLWVIGCQMTVIQDGNIYCRPKEIDPFEDC